jgi:glycosyltransferase involved in cell wall biosynthesis
MDRAGTDWRLVIAGGPGREGRHEQEIRNTVAALGIADQVRFVGHVPPETLAELMCAADVFCLASSREGWPNVLHEAMACGTPIVATSVGSVPDMAPSEDYGLVTPPGCIPSLSRALRCAFARQWDRSQIARWAKARDWNEVAREVAFEFAAIVPAAAH